MATTNIPTETKSARDEAVERAKANRGAGVTANSDDGDMGDLDAQARAAVEDRAGAFFDSTVAGARIRMNAELATADEATRKAKMDEFQKRVDEDRKKAVDEGMAIYEDAIKRRGHRQAAMDQLQGAVGLPADPKRRQAEIERRTKEGDAAMSAQSGVGTVADNLEGRLVGTRIDEYFGDAARAEFNPHVQDGHGANIAQMAQAAHRLQQIAPEAPMTQENVNDPHGAKERMEKDRSQQASQPVAARVSGDNRSTVPPAEQRIDQRGAPGGHPATEGGLQATDPLLPGSVKQSEANRMAMPAAEREARENEAKRDQAQVNAGQKTNPAVQPKPDAQGLTKEQIEQRNKVAGTSDPS